MKKLIKYETKPNHVEDNRVRNARENVINVTIIKESKPTYDSTDDKSLNLKSIIPKADKETQSMETKSSRAKHAKDGKKIFQLKKHKKLKNGNIIFKRGDCSCTKDGIIVRNTPTDLYQKYSNDWKKFKSLIPGENSRESVRKSVRAKMQQKEDEQPNVIT